MGYTEEQEIGYRSNAVPDIKIDKLPLWLRIKPVLGSILPTIVVLLVVIALVFIPVLGCAALLQYVVTACAGHEIGTYPVYCAIVSLYFICNTQVKTKSKD